MEADAVVAPTAAAVPRRKKTAAERRTQYQRAQSRAVSRILSGFVEIQSHRGNRLSLLAEALRCTLQEGLKKAAGPGRKNCSQEGARCDGGPGAPEVPRAPEGHGDVSGEASAHRVPMDTSSGRPMVVVVGTNIAARGPPGVQSADAAPAQLAATLAESNVTAEEVTDMVERRLGLVLKTYRFMRSRPVGTTPTQSVASRPLFCTPAVLEEIHSEHQVFSAFCTLCWARRAEENQANGTAVPKPSVDWFRQHRGQLRSIVADGQWPQAKRGRGLVKTARGR
jgi:hypothetical protein